MFSFQDAPECGNLAPWVADRLRTQLRFEARDETWDRYASKFATMGGVVESFVEGAAVRSPSVQCRVDPLGRQSVISSHDQLLGGPSGQVYLGCTFPANPAYCQDIQRSARAVTGALAAEGVLGRFAIDFVSVFANERWENYAIEINIRKGGTTHPFLMLQFLTDGTYDAESGTFRTRTGRRRDETTGGGAAGSCHVA
ncbi:MAG: hypothetical protein M3081_07735 [Gemmatimonadota bacterium]|nr:hypothetical protein [Gemmatimonadota bacterium]